MVTLAWILAGAAILIAAIALEGWRQERRLRAQGKARGTRPSLIGVGALELQRLLQPDRRVEIVLEEQKRADRVRPEHTQQAEEGGDQP